MAYQNTYYAKGFVFTNKATGLPIDISAYAFRAQFRTTAASADPALLELTTANGGFVTTDGLGGRVEMRITSAQFASLPVGTVSFDVMRTDLSPGPRRLFGGKLRVKQPVTR